MRVPAVPIAYLAGLLSFFAPCGAVLLPSFFAYTFKKRSELIAATFWFLAGFLTLFIPLGLGIRVISSPLLLHRRELTWLGGIMFFGLAAYAFAGRGLHVPVPQFLTKRGFHNDALSSYLIGVVFGFTVAGCTAPLLGLVFALSAMERYRLFSFAVLAAYGVGLATPLLILAFVADRTKFLKHPALKGKLWTFTIGGKERSVHSTNAVAAAFMVVLGIVFIASQGTFFMGNLGADTKMMADFNVGAADYLANMHYK